MNAEKQNIQPLKHHNKNGALILTTEDSTAELGALIRQSEFIEKAELTVGKK